jgi:hypothetical protein
VEASTIISLSRTELLELQQIRARAAAERSTPSWSTRQPIGNRLAGPRADDHLRNQADAADGIRG